ncbi:MAG: DUF934 domain-containing protein [Alphaproteobacteria bacterium]
MPIIKDGAVVEDPWIFEEGETVLGGDAPIMVTLERWQADRERLMGHNGPIGLRLKDDQSPALVAEDLQRFSLIALEFPAFKNGRGYSSARLLRGRYGFTGEIRAVGDVLRDQVAFMARCGVDSFEVADGFDVAAWDDIMGEMSHVYQTSADGLETVLEKRHGS